MSMKNNLKDASRVRSTVLLSVLAVIWCVGFALWFHHFDLPNHNHLAEDRHLQRLALWTSLPYNLLDFLDPPASKPGESRSSLFFLAQRFPFVAVAAALWAGAWSLGSNALRLLRLRLEGTERFFFAASLGLSFLSLMMLGLGLSGLMSRWPLLLLLAASFLIQFLSRDQRTVPLATMPKQVGKAVSHHRIWTAGTLILIACIPFVLGALLGAMSPQTDFDVLEYHLEGPKEWFQRGRIERLPYNVYTNFPFLSEMLILSGMVVYGDWQWGALAGQALIAGFAPLTAIGLVAAGERFFSRRIGQMAALIYLTSPWTYRVSIIAYAEGSLACYLFAAFYSALISRQNAAGDSDPTHVPRSSIDLLTGLLAGSAMACKYTGLISVVVPVGLGLLLRELRELSLPRIQPVIRTGLIYALGVLCAVGPWLLKNSVETGNPVYPLGVRLFGGIDRDPELDAKWRRGHDNPYGSVSDALRDLPRKITDVVAYNDWHTPLMFGFAPLALLVYWVRKTGLRAPTASQKFDPTVTGMAWVYVGWNFFSWWMFTHHIDRFYVPMFSVVALLAGLGSLWWESIGPGRTMSPVNRWAWNSFAILFVTTSMLYNTNVMLCLGGFNAGRLDLNDALERIAIGRQTKWINDAYEAGQLPASTKVLCIGEAQMFHARFPYLYNTVFDHSIFEQIFRDPAAPGMELRPADDLRTELRRRGITHLQVNWADILRYRSPGSYGYTDFVHPERFAKLQEMGIIGPQCLPEELTLAPLAADQRLLLDEWAPELIRVEFGKPTYTSSQLFAVIDSP